MPSDTIYKRFTASCINCKSEISLSNFSKHCNSKQCIEKGGKCRIPEKRTNICKHCLKECKSIMAAVQHEVRCKDNPDIIHLTHIFKSKNRPIPPTECTHCGKIYHTQIGIKGHESRCRQNPDRKLQKKSAEGKEISRIKYKKWVEAHYSKDENRLKVSERMKIAVADHPDSYMGNTNKLIKRVYYDGIYFMGTWELEFYKWCIANNIKVERSKMWFEYNWNGVRRYNPDFFLPDLNIYVEIKGQQYERDLAKWNQFTESLHVLKLSEVNQIKRGNFSLEILLEKKWCVKQVSNL